MATSLLVARADEDHGAFRDAVRRFLAAGLEGSVLTSAGEHGFTGVGIAEEHGGGGVADPRFGSVLIEELMVHGATGLAVQVALSCGVIAPALARWGSEAQQARWLPSLATGRCLVALAGLEAGRPRLRAEDDGAFVLDGTLLSVVGAVDAALLVVVANTEAGEPAVLLLAPDQIELRLTGDPLKIAGAASADLVLDQVHVSAGQVLRGGTELIEQLQCDQDLWLAVIAVAGARTALTWASSYAGDRKVFGRALSSFENTVVVLAQGAVDLAMAQALLDAGLDRRGQGPLPEALASALVLGSTQVWSQVVDQGLQLHGGYGYMREYPISTLFSDSAAFRRWAAPGSSRQEVVSRQLGFSGP